MAPLRKMTFQEREKGVGVVASSSQQEIRDSCNGGGLDLLPSPVVPSKRVCPHCQREFKSPNALGGHIRIHNIKTKFTHERIDKRRPDLLHAPLLPIKKRKFIRDEQQQPPEVNILSRYLSDLSWKAHKKRGINRRRAMKFDVGYYGDVEDEHEDDIMERLRIYDINTTAHKIARIRRMYVCNPCQVFMRTFHDVLVHTDAKEFFVEVEQVATVGEENVEAGVKSPNEVNLSTGVEEDEMGAKASEENGDQAAGTGGPIAQNVSVPNPPRMQDFDLNEIPPNED